MASKTIIYFHEKFSDRNQGKKLIFCCLFGIEKQKVQSIRIFASHIEYHIHVKSSTINQLRRLNVTSLKNQSG